MMMVNGKRHMINQRRAFIESLEEYVNVLDKRDVEHACNHDEDYEDNDDCSSRYKNLLDFFDE